MNPASFTFKSSGTSFKINNYTDLFEGGILISPKVKDKSGASISSINIGESYTILADKEYAVTGEFRSLDVSGNQLTSLDVSGMTNLDNFLCYNNNLKKLDLTDLDGIRLVHCNGNDFTVCGLDSIFLSLPVKSEDEKGDIYIANNDFENGFHDKCRTNIANANNWLVKDYKDGEDEVEIINTEFDCEETKPKGFTFISSGTSFLLNNNTELNEGDIIISPEVEDEYGTSISSIDIEVSYTILADTKYTIIGKFKKLDLFDNQLTSLDVLKLTSLEYLQCSDNNLKKLDFTDLDALERVFCDGNDFTVCGLDSIFLSLPSKPEDNKGAIFIASADLENDINDKCRTGIANAKNWIVYDDYGDGSIEINNTKFDCEETSIPESLSYDLDINIFPNPVNDALQIESEEIIKQVAIFDVFGKLLIKESVNETNFNLSTADLKSGIYVLRVESTKGVNNYKLIKE